MDDAELSPHEFRLLVHYYRVGVCWESVRTTAEICQMNKETVISARRSLEEKGWLEVHKTPQGITITLIDRWDENMQSYLEGVPSNRTPVRKEGIGLYGKRETKKNHRRRTLEEDEQLTLSIQGEIESQVEKPPSPLEELAHEIADVCGIATDLAGVLYPAANTLIIRIGSIPDALQALRAWAQLPGNRAYAVRVGPYGIFNQVAVKYAQIKTEDTEVIRGSLA